MRALTLTQPWATLVAIGAKRIETRSWYSPHRGPLAIHAAKGMPKWAHDFADELIDCSLAEYGFKVPIDLPRGAVVATCRLFDVRRIATLTRDAIQAEASDELAFGDFTPGRYAWFLADVVPLPTPIPARGQLGLWEWDETTHGLTLASARTGQIEMAL